ncbi:hypothetical protein MSL71_49080 [Desulfoluna butyratoxydans]|uniref:Uncharacterized protein n=1 Tax=Desulfoluna butyratoxydans TaxID=231438 RepID=A0A4U8YUX1_9BACT|nr:hypothetical protein MSL71_49080 [Desulfoluna butyratoxydans]
MPLPILHALGLSPLVAICHPVGWAKRSVPVVARVASVLQRPWQRPSPHTMGTAPRVSPFQRSGLAFAHPTCSRLIAVGRHMSPRRMGKAERAHRCAGCRTFPKPSWNWFPHTSWISSVYVMGTAPGVSPLQWGGLAFAHPTCSRLIAICRHMSPRRMGKAKRAHRCAGCQRITKAMAETFATHDGHGAEGVATPMERTCLCPSYMFSAYRRWSPYVTP